MSWAGRRNAAKIAGKVAEISNGLSHNVKTMLMTYCFKIIRNELRKVEICEYFPNSCC